MTPTEQYQTDLQRDDFNYDPSQEMAIGHLQRLYDELVAAERESQKISISQKLVKRFLPAKKISPLKGLYFWGGVGRGKTYLMDTFYECLPFQRKMRMHFHRFMQHVHNELTQLKGEKNPLEKVADSIADSTRIICFDEFFVSDIGDAMILAGLLGHLFDRGVSLVTTSNIVPDGLYKDGLQRSRFLPAIALLNEHTEVVNVDGGTDHRLRTLEQAELYHAPLDDEAEKSLSRSFQRLAPEKATAEQAIDILGRKLVSKFCADDVVWFDFETLCDGPRSQNDYIELARCFHAVLISDVPVFNGHNDDQARRFINLVDEFYDRNVKLILSAQENMESLYQSGRLSFEFERTVSRLLEMQSTEYLAREHRP